MIFESFPLCCGPEKASLDKDLAKLGDCVVNLIYSLARSIARDKPDGGKAPNEVLSQSLKDAGLRYLAPSRVDKHRLGDVTEAIVAYAWLEEKIKIEESAIILSRPLSKVDFENRKEVWRAAEIGFKNLLITISERMDFEKSELSGNKDRN